MTLSYSRDPFCCFTTSQDLQTFFNCHRRAFAHFGGAPVTIVTTGPKTSSAAMLPLVRRSRCIRKRSVSPATTTSTSTSWLPTGRKAPGRAAGPDRPRPRSVRPVVLLRRRDGRRVHGLGARAAGSVPQDPPRGHRRAGGKRPRGSQAAAPDSVSGGRTAAAARRQGLPGRLRRQPLLRAGPQGPSPPAGRQHATLADAVGSTLLAAHPRAIGRGARVVDESHWNGLPTGKNHRTTTGDIPVQPRQERPRARRPTRCRPC